ncbi:hypothetical protein TWF506_007496 [Arthrobotrys conoides]|uniref:Extracellular membrane protein CFEM domain-containing protein n=1 Tax=Arthrobotrys conoides TaxID=74498 RepID=A0AAN8N7D4_9PEZI
MQIHTFIQLTAILASLVSTQTIPDTCTRAARLAQSCIPDERYTIFLVQNQFSGCLCSTSFNKDATGCITDAASILLNTDTQALEAFKAYCALSNVGSIPKNSTSPIQPDARVPDGSILDSVDCYFFIRDLESSLLFSYEKSIVDGLCHNSTDSVAKECYNYIFDSDPNKASAFGAFLDFCSRHSTGSSNRPKTVQTVDSQTTLFPISPSSPSQASGPHTTSDVVQNSAIGLEVTIFDTVLASLLTFAFLAL